jgi:hypothetical protein
MSQPNAVPAKPPHPDPDPPHHDILLRLIVRRHHVGVMTPNTAHNVLAKLKRHIAVSSRGRFAIELAEVHSVTHTRGRG